jgi:hypothetical protein
MQSPSGIGFQRSAVSFQLDNLLPSPNSVTPNPALPDNSTREYQLATGFQIPHSKFQRIRSGLEVGIWNLELAGKAPQPPNPLSSEWRVSIHRRGGVKEKEFRIQNPE